MLTNIRRAIRGYITDLRMHCKNNKEVLIFVSISVSIGIVLALQGIKPEASFQGNMIVLIQKNEFNLFFFLLKCVGLLFLLYSALIFCRHHFFFLLLNLLLAVFLVKAIFMNLFLSFMCDGMLSFLYLLIYWMPVMVFSFFCYFNIHCRIFCLMGYDKKKFRPLCCPSMRAFIDILTKAFLIHLIPIIIHTLVVCLILNLIF
jgi:hypothetical protein